MSIAIPATKLITAVIKARIKVSSSIRRPSFHGARLAKGQVNSYFEGVACMRDLHPLATHIIPEHSFEIQGNYRKTQRIPQRKNAMQKRRDSASCKVECRIPPSLRLICLYTIWQVPSYQIVYGTPIPPHKMCQGVRGQRFRCRS